jgi:hypothetical protein
MAMTFEQWWEEKIAWRYQDYTAAEWVARAAWNESYNAGYNSAIKDYRLKFEDNGWDCPISPTGKCEYKNGDMDACDHCGEPEERK